MKITNVGVGPLSLSQSRRHCAMPMGRIPEYRGW